MIIRQFTPPQQPNRKEAARLELSFLAFIRSVPKWIYPPFPAQLLRRFNKSLLYWFPVNLIEIFAKILFFFFAGAIVHHSSPPPPLGMHFENFMRSLKLIVRSGGGGDRSFDRKIIIIKCNKPTTPPPSSLSHHPWNDPQAMAISLSTYASMQTDHAEAYKMCNGKSSTHHFFSRTTFSSASLLIRTTRHFAFLNCGPQTLFMITTRDDVKSGTFLSDKSVKYPI